MGRTGKTRVVVAGGGFGGVYAALYLCGDDIDTDTLEVTLVSERNHFTFTPLLHEILGGSLEGRHCAAPYRVLSPGPCFRFVQARVEGVDPDAGRVETTAGTLDYDYLILALGARPMSPVEGPRLAAHGNGGTGAPDLRIAAFQWISHATALHDRILEMAERAGDESDAARRRRLLTFVVGGGGPAGVEAAGELLELLRHVLPRHYVGLDDARVVLAHGEPRILEGWNEELAEAGQDRLREAGLELHLETFVDSVDEHVVRLASKDGDDSVEAMTLVDTMGVVPNSECLEGAGFELGDEGHVLVDEFLRVRGRERIFCVGDLNELEHPRTGERYPDVAPIALSQGARAAFNVLSERGGWSMEPYAGDHTGKIVSLGGHQALVEILGFRMKGRAAWWVNRLSYLTRLVGTRNKAQAATTLLLNRIFTRNLTSGGILR